MAKIQWQNDRNAMSGRRLNSIAELPQMFPDSEGFKYAPMHSGRAQGGKTYRQLLRESQFETSGADNSIAELGSDLPSSEGFSEEPMHSGPTRGGESTTGGGKDFRTDQYMEEAAKKGQLEGFNDPRSKAFKATYGKGGPLYDRYTYEELEANPKLKELKKLVNEAATPDRGIGSDTKPYISFVGDSWFDRTPQANKAVEAYTGYGTGTFLKAPKRNFTLTGRTGMVNPMNPRNMAMTNTKYLDDYVDEEEELYNQIQALK